MLSTPLFLAFASFILAFAFIVFGVIVRRDYTRKGRLSWFSSFLEITVFFLLGVFTWIDLPVPWPSPDLNPILKGIAWILMAIGLVCMFATITIFGLRRALGLQVDVLKTTGLYAKSRNPQILFCSLFVLGYILLWPSWHTAGWGILYAAVIYKMVLIEEEHLQNKFTDQYKRYCEQVPRFLLIP